MKRVGLFLVVFSLAALIVHPASAQIAKIIDVSGEVQVRQEASQEWQKAKPNMYLDDEAEIKTGSGSQCILTFDEELDNVLTIKGDSHIKIEDVKKGKIYLPKGRVFSLIDDLVKLEDFQIRTPTAVAGVKGTGESVEATESGTTVKCYEGSAYAQGIDKAGNLTGKEDLTAGVGVDISETGVIKYLFILTDDDWKNWDYFRENINTTTFRIMPDKIRKKPPNRGFLGNIRKPPPVDNLGNFKKDQPLGDKTRDDLRDNLDDLKGNTLRDDSGDFKDDNLRDDLRDLRDDFKRDNLDNIKDERIGDIKDRSFFRRRKRWWNSGGK